MFIPQTFSIVISTYKRADFPFLYFTGALKQSHIVQSSSSKKSPQFLERDANC